MSLSYFDRLSDAQDAGYDSETAHQYAEGSHRLTVAQPDIDELLEDLAQAGDAEQMAEALRYLLRACSNADRAHVVKMWRGEL